MTPPETLQKLHGASRAEVSDYARGALPPADVEEAAELLTQEKLAALAPAGDGEPVT